jgi:hypothetical protein
VTVGDGLSGLGETRHKWTPEVRREVQAVLNRFSAITANTYICHPWCGWGKVSVDLWGPGGRGHAIDRHLGLAALQFLFNRPGAPFLRHTIFEHELWTSFGGKSYWARDDHSGVLRHVHLTYWPT